MSRRLLLTQTALGMFLSCGVVQPVLHVVPRIDEIIWTNDKKSTDLNKEAVSSSLFLSSSILHDLKRAESCPWHLVQNFATTNDKIEPLHGAPVVKWIYLENLSQGDSIRQELDMQKMEISSASADLSRPNFCPRRCLRRL